MPTPPLEPFFLGFSYAHDVDFYYPWEPPDPPRQIDHLYRDLKASGAAWFRPHVVWNRVEPEIPPEAPAPPPTDADVAAYSSRARWSEVDLLVEGAQKAGIRLDLVLGCAYTVQLPKTTVGGEKGWFLPDRVGRERYLNRLALHARAVVRRYKDKVALWQLENELNVAGETLFFRWRHGRGWWSRSFQDQIMRTLHDAVRAEDPGARTTTNFHTDLKIAPFVYSWKSDVRRWAPYLDVIGLDTYPNYLFGLPNLSGMIRGKVRGALGVGLGKPVIIQETGYPAHPGYRLFNEARQARYVEGAIAAARSAGATGYFHYSLTSHERGADDPRWEGRGVPPLQAVERYWGLVREDNSYRPALDAFRRAAAGR